MTSSLINQQESRRRKSPSIESHLGKKLKSRRQFLKLSQEDLAKKIGLTSQQVHKYERGKDHIPASRLYELSKVLSVPLSFFYEGIEGKRGADQELRSIERYLTGKKVRIQFSEIEGHIETIQVLYS